MSEDKQRSPIRFLMGYLELHGRFQWIKDVSSLWWRGFEFCDDHVEMSNDDVKQLLSITRWLVIDDLCGVAVRHGLSVEMFENSSLKDFMGKAESARDLGFGLRVDKGNIDLVLAIVIAEFSRRSPLGYFELMRIAT